VTGRDARRLTADLGGRASTHESGDAALEAPGLTRPTTPRPTRDVVTPSAS
jgi:hypothetical protein